MPRTILSPRMGWCSRFATAGLALAAAVFLFAASPVAQTISASASVTPSRVAVGQTVTYTLTIRGGSNIQASAPAGRDGLQLRSPQPSLDVRSNVNGRTERKLAWVYVATRAGVGTIAPARIEVDRAVLDVDAARVTIAPAGSARQPSSGPPSQTASPSGEIFVRAEPSSLTVVVGQQVVVNYVLYFKPQLQPRQTAPVGTWDAPGFWREEMDIPTAYPRPTTLGGVPYEAVTIRRMAVFPTRSGSLSLAPMKFSVDLLRTSNTYDNDPFAPFFSPFSSQYEEEEVQAPALSLAVSPLPDGAPATFAGAVGSFELSSTASTNSVRVGDPIQISLTLSGTGNVATVSAPALQSPKGFDVYDPREEQEIDRTGNPLSGTKTFTYTLVPQGGGVFEFLPVVWTYFDPAAGTYKTLRSDAFPVEVDGPPLADAPRADPNDPNVPDSLMATASWRRQPASPVVLWSILGFGAVLPLVAAFGLVLARTRRVKPSRAPAPEADTSTRPVRGLRERVDRESFYSDAEDAIRSAMGERFGLPSHASRLDVIARMKADAAFARFADDVDAILLDIERAQYAPGLAAGAARANLARRVEAAVANVGVHSSGRKGWRRLIPVRRTGQRV